MTCHSFHSHLLSRVYSTKVAINKAAWAARDLYYQNVPGGGPAFEAFLRSGLALKPHAPRLRVVTFDRERLSFLLGPGGQTKRAIELEFDCVLDVGDVPDTGDEAAGGGTTTDRGVLGGGGATTTAAGSTSTSSKECVVHVFGATKASCDAATKVVQELVCDVAKGAVLRGTITELRDFGALVDVLRGRAGLLHITEVVRRHFFGIDERRRRSICVGRQNAIFPLSFR